MTRLETGVVAVTVYPDRARPVRLGKLNVTVGRHTLEVQDLPLVLNPDSLRVAARGTAGVRLHGLQVQRVFYTETPSENARELEIQLEALQDEIRAVEVQAELSKQYRSRLEALGAHSEIYATALAAGELRLEAQLALFDGLRQRVTELDKEQQALAVQRRELERRLEQTKNRLNQVRSSRPRERYAAYVDLEIFRAGDLTVELSYVVTSAGWKPLYDLRFLEESDQPALEVGYLAQVTQQTGEAWENVEMTLSTARPALAGTVPELKPWYIRPRPPVMAARAPMMEKAQVAPAPMPMMATLGAGLEGAAFAEEMKAEVAVASVASTGAAVTYRLPSVVSIPADGAPHEVNVAHYSLTPHLDYVTAPGIVAAAYRRAKATNASAYTLLPGAVNLFAGEEFIGTTALELTAPQGEIELYLGADDRLKVERELKRREVDKSLIGSKRRVRYAYEIRLENLLPTDAQVLLHDQMPVSQHEDIRVRLEAADPKPTSQSELNLLDWELSLKAKEKRTLRFDFTVEYPQSTEILGLP